MGRSSVWALNASGGRKRWRTGEGKGVSRRQAGDAATSQGRLAAPASGQARTTVPGSSRGKAACRFQSSKTDSGPLGSSAMRTHFCSLKPPALWSPVTAGTGNSVTCPSHTVSPADLHLVVLPPQHIAHATGTHVHASHHQGHLKVILVP